MSSRPRLLFISPRFLFPLDEGGKIRTAGMLRAMKGGPFHITLVAPAPATASVFSSEIESVCDRFLSWPQYRPGTAARFLAFLGQLPVSTKSEQSKAGRKLISDEINRGAEVVIFDYAHAGLLAPEQVHVPSVLFTHNIEAEILERHATIATGAIRAVWKREARKMDKFERCIVHKFDTVIAVSFRDAEALKSRYGLRRVDVIDTGVDLEYYKFSPPELHEREKGQTIAFVGAMDSKSNIDGVDFMMDRVWPLVEQRRSDLSMVIVGRNPPGWLVGKASKKQLPWRFTGTVQDVRPHIISSDIVVIPLRVGSGTRLKAVEAMALGRPVVSTRLGVEGLPLVSGEHYVSADDPEEFAAAICNLVQNPGERFRIASKARQLLQEKFSWAVVGRQFEAICQRTINQETSDMSPQLI